MKRGGFLHELSRRRVWQVAGAYIILGWVFVEIVLETFPMLGFPDWVPMAVVIAAYAGFPVVVMLAWLFDITPQGLVLTPKLPVLVQDDEEEKEDEAPAPRVVVQARPALLAGVFGAGMIFALVAFGAYSVIVPAERVRPEAIQSLAVMPFTDLSPDGDKQHFADGMADELISRLSRIGEIRVAARTSSFQLKEAEATLADIGRQLKVDAVVDGSVRRDGDQLRVIVELVDVASGFQVWSGRYDRTMDDLFVVQDEISGAIVDALSLHLGPAEQQTAGTTNLRAHDAYLLGLARWHGRTREDLLRARDYFLEALAQDPEYDLAHAGLALTYAVLPLYHDIPADQALEAGYAAAARALALNAHLAEAHAAIGHIALYLEWNLVGAEVAYRRALESRPNYATGHHWYAEALLIMGRLAEAREEIGRALELDPLSVAAQYIKAYLLVVERDYDGALTAFTDLVERHPGFTLGHESVVLLCLAAGCFDQAERAAFSAYPDKAAIVLEVIRARRDPSLRSGALAALAGARDQLPSVQLALFHSALGDRDTTLEILESTQQSQDDPMLPLFLVHPLFDELRQEPRFRKIADAIGVEAPTARLAQR